MYSLVQFVADNLKAFLLGFLLALLGFVHAQPGAFTPYGLVNVRVANSSLLPTPSMVVNPSQILNLDDSMMYTNMGTGVSPWVPVYRFGTPLSAGYGLQLAYNKYWADTSQVASINYSYSKTAADGLFYLKTNPNGYISSYIETDPTVANYIKAITTTNISNWNSAYGWGNHNGQYPLLSGSYSNPTWITSLAYSKLTGAPSLATVATTGAYSDLTGKPTIYSFTGSSAQYTKGDGTYGTLPSVISPSFNTPSRSLNSNYTISTTQNSRVYYSVRIAYNITILIGSTGVATLQYSTNSGSTWISVQSISNSLNLGLALTGYNDFSLQGEIPANALVRITTTGTVNATVTIRPEQLEITY